MARIADRTIILSDEDIGAIRRIKASAVKPDLRHAELGKYTFLKVHAFQDLGYDHHIFMDVDMLCLDETFAFGGPWRRP